MTRRDLDVSASTFVDFYSPCEPSAVSLCDAASTRLYRGCALFCDERDLESSQDDNALHYDDLAGTSVELCCQIRQTK